jgi:hypothetical protein
MFRFVNQMRQAVSKRQNTIDKCLPYGLFAYWAAMASSAAQDHIQANEKRKNKANAAKKKSQP